MRILILSLIFATFPFLAMADYCLYSAKVETNNTGDTIQFNGEKKRTGGYLTIFEGMLKRGEPVDISIIRGKLYCAGSVLFSGDEIILECGQKIKGEVEFTTQGVHPICFKSKIKAKAFMKLRIWF